MERLRSELKTLRDQQEVKISEALDTQRGKLTEQEKSAVEKLQGKIVDLEAELNEKNDELLGSEEKLLNLTEELEAIQKRAQDLEDSEAEMRDLNKHLEMEVKDIEDNWEANKRDLYEQLDQKDKAYSETYLQLTQAKKQLSEQETTVEEAENAIRDYRAQMRKLEDEKVSYEERYNANEAEMAQMRDDMQTLVSYKNDLEVLVDEQTQNITMTSKRAHAMEEQLRNREADMNQLEATCRRASESAAESKKKLLQAEVKIRQLTGATVKDLKMNVKQKKSEIDVLKEMVRATSNQLKTKDNDIVNLSERV